MPKQNEFRNRETVGSSEHSSNKSTMKQGLTFKSLIVTFIGMLVAMYIVINGEWFGRFMWGASDSSISTPNIPATGFVLILLIVINPILRWIGNRLRNNLALTDGDLTIVFNVVTAASQTLHLGFATVLFAMTTGMALVRDNIITEYFSSLSRLIIFKDFQTVLFAYMGRGDIPWSTWIPIFITWGVFFAAVIFMYQCVAVIVHRSWRYQDHLTYPTVKPILMLTEKADQGFPPVWKNRWMWIGLAIALVYRGLPSLHTYFPVIPTVNHFWLGTMFSPLVNSNRFFAIVFGQTSLLGLPLWPWALSLMWLVVSANVLFSIWFFAVFRGVYCAILDMYGLLGYRGLPFADAQPGWLFVMLGVYYVWSMRRTLAEVWRISIGKQKESLDGPEQALSTKTAVFGGIAAFVFIIVFACYFFSITWWMAIPFMLFITLADIALARFRAEAGFGYHGNISSPPRISGTFQIAGITDLLGGKIVGRRNFLGLGYLGILTNTFNINVGSTLESLHMAEATGVKPRSLIKGIWLGSIVIAVLGFVIGWPMVHKNGGLNQLHWLASYSAYYGGTSWWESLGAIIRDKGNTGFNFFQFVCLLVPMSFMGFLMFMHTRFVWWPFHPIGFGIAAADFCWRWSGPAFVAWALKSLAFRWGGRGAWVRMNPFFIGLLAGDFLVQVLQTAVSIFINT